MPVFRSVRSRLVFYFLGLVSLVQVVAFLAVDYANSRFARDQLAVVLSDGVLSTRRVVEARTAEIAAPIAALSGDAALKEAVAQKESASITARLRSIGARTGAELMLFASPDRKLAVDGSTRPVGGASLGRLQKLIETADRDKRTAGVITVEEQAYYVVVVPVSLAEGPAWIAAGFGLDGRLAEDLQQITRLETSFVVREGDGMRRIVASSLPVMRRAALGMAIARAPAAPGEIVSTSLFGEEFLGRFESLGRDGGDGVEVLLQRSLSKELEPFDNLRAIVLFLSIGGLVLSVFGAVFVARTVTEPVLALAEAARSIAKGDYAPPIPAGDKGEMGELTAAFSGMAQGLAERDRMRDVLGKVVSPEVAGKILSQGVELGGEARVVTVLFCDLRRLRAFSAPYLAQHSTRESIELMNVYLTRMSEVIEAHHGVVDRFLGSGIMALFGAPLQHDDDAGNAIAAALAMQRNLGELSDELARNGLPKLGMGIGIDTGKVIAGNIGSPNRLSYTVIGECVNFAARLEGLAAHGGVQATILASAETMRRSKRRFAARPMAVSAARGSGEPDLIYAVLGDAAAETGKPAELAVPG